MFQRLIDAVATNDERPKTNEQVGATTDDRQPTTEGKGGAVVDGQPSAVGSALLDEVEQKLARLLDEVKQFTESRGDPAPIAREVRAELAVILELPVLDRRFGGDAAALAAIGEVQSNLNGSPATWGALFGWAFVHALGKIAGAADHAEQSRSWIDEFLLGRIIDGALRDLGLDEPAAARAVAIIRQATSHQDWYTTPDMEETSRLLESLLSDRAMQQLLGVNRYQGVLWFDKGAFERLLWWMLTIAVVAIAGDPDRTPAAASAAIAAAHATVRQLQEAAGSSGYQVEKLLAIVQA